ncbi:MAG: hypothetical protein EFT35_07000 [Methanophagales archaeon ANME-1-THS]|nr:MAG: hypothetical protein EFT35_07000 [Methanophagales archaeon ANME-1-THS]
MMRSKDNVTPSLLTIFIFIVITMIAALMPVVSGEVVAIANLNDSYIYQEVTVAGSIVSVRSWQGTVYIMTVDDGSGTVLVKYESRLLENPQGGQRVTVTGVYEGKNTIYAKNFGVAATSGYTDTTVAELKKYPAYYYGDPVRVRGDVSKIILTHNKTELVVDDDTGEIKVVLYGVVMEDLNLDDKIAVEGRCYQDTISAFAIKVEKARPSTDPIATQSSTPSPVTQPTPPPESNPGSSSASSSTPAFELLPALGALLTVAYLLTRRK